MVSPTMGDRRGRHIEVLQVTVTISVSVSVSVKVSVEVEVAVIEERVVR